MQDSQLKSAFQTSSEPLVPIPLIKQNTKRAKKENCHDDRISLQKRIARFYWPQSEKRRRKRKKKMSDKKSLFTTSKCSHKSKKITKKVEDSESEVEDEECLCRGEF